MSAAFKCPGGKNKPMARFYVNVFLDAFKTNVSGDLVGEGEFYFKCNDSRFPDDGEIKLGKEEVFNPKPNPSIYTAMVDSKEKEVKLKIKVKEADPLKDDTFINEKLMFPLKPTNDHAFELKDKKGRCILKCILNIVEAKNW